MARLVVDLGKRKEGERYSSLIEYELQAAVDLVDTSVEMFEENSVEVGDKITIDIAAPEVLADLRDILDKTWSRPIVLTQHHDDNEATAAVEMLGSVALMDLQRLTMQPVEYNMGDERYDDLSIQTILEDGISEVNFKDRFARANFLCAKLAMENIQDAKEKMNEVLRITG